MLGSNLVHFLSVQLDWKDGFFLDLDDYLIGLLLLANELVRPFYKYINGKCFRKTQPNFI